MTYKILGITSGRKDSNSEILLKESLLACQEQDAEVTMINLRDYNILDCTGCTACTHGMSKGKYVGCTLDKRDDKKAIMEVFFKADAIILSIPTFDLMANSTYLQFAHRNLAYCNSFLESIGAIEHKDRIAGLISVGGSSLSWQSMALESLQASCVMNNLKVVDMYLAERAAAPKQCLLYDDMIERVHKLGENVMKSLKTSVEERKWVGDENMGWCPNCHSNALIKGGKRWDGLYFEIECQVCGAGGTLEKTDDGDWKFVIQENGLCRDRTSTEGSAEHLVEINVTQGGFYTEENLKVVKEKFRKYKELQFPTIKIKI